MKEYSGDDLIQKYSCRLNMVYAYCRSTKEERKHKYGEWARKWFPLNVMDAICISEYDGKERPYVDEKIMLVLRLFRLENETDVERIHSEIKLCKEEYYNKNK